MGKSFKVPHIFICCITAVDSGFSTALTDYVSIVDIIPSFKLRLSVNGLSCLALWMHMYHKLYKNHQKSSSAYLPKAT